MTKQLPMFPLPDDPRALARMTKAARSRQRAAVKRAQYRAGHEAAAEGKARRRKVTPEERDEPEHTISDDVAFDYWKERIAGDLEKLHRQPRTPENLARVAELEGITDGQIATWARYRCEYCGADPREDLEVEGRQLVGGGCCLAGSEKLAEYLSEIDASERGEWARRWFGPWLPWDIAYVTGDMKEQRRRGEWEELPEAEQGFQVSYELDVRIVLGNEARLRIMEFVGRYHHHTPEITNDGWKFGIEVWNGPDLIGVAYVQPPGGRLPHDGSWLEVSRVAIRRDLPWFVRQHASSRIYSTAWQAGRSGSWRTEQQWVEAERANARKIELYNRAMGEFRAGQRDEAPKQRPAPLVRRAIRMVTYTLHGDESGRSLMASGWEPAQWVRARGEQTGGRKGRKAQVLDKAKIRWQIGLSEHRRLIVRLARKLQREDVVEVLERRGAGGPRPAAGQTTGAFVRTLAVRLYRPDLADGQDVPGQLWTWEPTEEERARMSAERVEAVRAGLPAPARRMNPDEGRRGRGRRAMTGDHAEAAALVSEWARSGQVDADPRVLEAVNGSPLVQAALARLSREMFNRAFVAASGETLGSEWKRDQWWVRHEEDRRRSMHRVLRYWRLANHPNSIPWENVSGYTNHQDSPQLMTPTAEAPIFSGHLAFVDCERPIPWQCAPDERAEHDGRPLAGRFPIRQVPVLVLQVDLFDSNASYDTYSGWDRSTVGLGGHGRLELHLGDALSELFYGASFRPLSGWNFDSPFVVRVSRGTTPVRETRYGPPGDDGTPVWRGLDYPVRLQIVHPLTPVLIRTPRPDAPGLALDLPAGNPVLPLIVQELQA